MKASMLAGLAQWNRADCIESLLGSTDQTLWADGAGGTATAGNAVLAAAAGPSTPDKFWSIQGTKIVSRADGTVTVVAYSMDTNQTTVLETICLAEITKAGTYFIPDGWKAKDANKYLKVVVTKNSTSAEVRVFGVGPVS